MESVKFSSITNPNIYWLFGPLANNRSGDFYICGELIGPSVYTLAEMRRSGIYHEEQIDLDICVDDVF